MRIPSSNHSTVPQYILDLPIRNKLKSLTIIQKNGETKSISSFEYFNQIQKMAKALVEVNIKKGDRIAIFSNSRHEWSVCDLAAISMGAIVVPLYPNMTTDDLAYILNHSECKLIFIENRMALRQIMLIRENCPKLETFVLFDPPLQQDGGHWMSLNEFLSGVAQQAHPSFNFERLCHQANPTDPVTFIYTSGTTGQPKAVVLNHTQIIHETTEVFAALQITEEDHTYSFLPFSHVLGRTEHWGHLIIGYQMTYSSGLERLAEELPMVEPTIIVAVPRIFEKIYTSLKTKIETSIIDNSIFNWAFKIGTEVSKKQQLNKAIDFKLNAEYTMAQIAILNRLKHQLFGTKLRFAICGSAPLSTEILQFFHSCGILILEGYGLTETTGAVCVNRPYDFEFGTVGKPLNKARIKIASDGEILIDSPTNMVGYFNDQEETKSVFQNNWLLTGDIGKVLQSGRLTINDRKKDLIKTAYGKYIAPQKLEGMLKELPFISQAHIHGDQKKYIVALLTIDKTYLFNEAREKNIPFKSLDDLKENQVIIDLIRSGVAKVNLNLSNHESIKNYAVLSEDFSIEAGEITPSLKLRRRIIDQKYKKLLNSLYD